MLLLRYLVCLLGLFLCLGNVAQGFEFIDKNATVTGNITVDFYPGSTEGFLDANIHLQYYATTAAGWNAPRTMTMEIYRQSNDTWSQKTSLNYNLSYQGPREGDVYATAANIDTNFYTAYRFKDGSGNVFHGGNINYVPPVSVYQFSKLFTEPGPLEIEVRDEFGNVIKSQAYFIEEGEMLNFDMEYDFPFSVHYRSTQYEEGTGWITNFWNTLGTATETVVAQATGSFNLPVVERAGLYGDQYNNPNLPYDPNTGDDGQQIINAISAAIGNTNSRIDALKVFLKYYHDSSAQAQTNILQAVNQQGADILEAIADIDFSELDDDFDAVEEAVFIVNDAVADLDLAISQHVNGMTTRHLELLQRSDDIEDLLEEVRTDLQDTTKIDAISAAISELQTELQDGNQVSVENMAGLIASLQALTTEMALDTDSENQTITTLASKLDALITGVVEMDFTGVFDESSNEQLQLLAQNTDQLETLTGAVGEAVITASNSETAILQQIADNMPEAQEPAPDYTEKFDTLIANQERQITNQETQISQHVDYTPKIQELIDKPEVDNGDKLDAILGELEQKNEFDQALTDEGGLFDVLLNPKIEIVTDALDAAQAAAESAEETMANNAASEIAAYGTPGGYASVSSSMSWPVATIPIIGTIDFNPHNQFPWIGSFASFIHQALKWAACLGFLVWFWKEISDSVQAIGLTPVQGSSGGGATGGIAILKQAGVITLFLTICMGAIMGFLIKMRDPVQWVLAEMVGGNILQGAPGAVAGGFALLSDFVPMGVLLTLAILRITVKQVQIPLMMGIQVVIRLTTI